VNAHLTTERLIRLLTIIIFLFIITVIVINCYHHNNSLQHCIDELEEKMESFSLSPEQNNYYHKPAMKDEFRYIKNYQSYIVSVNALKSFLLYLPGVVFTLFVSFVCATVSEFYLYTKLSTVSKWIIHTLDAVPLIFWVFLALGLTYKMINWSNQLNAFYYPALNISYCSVLMVIFYSQNVRKIAEIKASNIINGEKVSGISNIRIIWRMFRFQFLKTILFKQSFYAIIYMILFDYSFMNIYKDHQQIGFKLTTLAFNAGLFFSKYEGYNLYSELKTIAMVYRELHDVCFCLIAMIIVMFYALLFWFYDVKALTDD